MNKKTTVTHKLKLVGAYVLTEVLLLNPLLNLAHADSAADYVAIPPLINTSSSGDKPNVLVILDNSNSMDEAPSGRGVGSANPGSKSEIARGAVKSIIDNFGNTTRMGLMAYRQSNIQLQHLHDSQYDVSYNPSNYDPNYTGDRASKTKRFRVPNPTNSGAYIYYNVALPFYSGSPQWNRFCYSSTADFDNGGENPSFGPWDIYNCYRNKTGTRDNFNGFSSATFNSRFSPTDSDYAQNILDFGTNLTWQYIGATWFSKTSPGRGYLHVEIDDVDAQQKKSLTDKLATSQFSSASDTPLRNAGLTPIEGSLQSALDYYSGKLPAAESTTSRTPARPPLNQCSQQDYVILVTDGLPSTTASGNLITDTQEAVERAALEAKKLRDAGIKTYVVGFGLPTGVNAALLDKIAIAGGTGQTYLANDSVTLIKSLESIFLSFSNRDASSSSSAVLANNSRGEGAVFQAIYSPKGTDSLGNEVTWAGNVFGLFLDENGLLREDTNQNDQLDGYNTDRVVRYIYDNVAKKTQVELFVGSGVSSAPNTGSDTPVATVDVDELNTLWDARDQLNELNNVSSQRVYSSNATNGRYIVSSVDGKNLINFIEASSASAAEQEATARRNLQEAEELRDINAAYLEAARQSIESSVALRDSLIAPRDAALADLATAQSELEEPARVVADARAEYDAARAEFSVYADDYSDNYAARDSALSGAINDYDNQLSSTDLANSAEDEFNALVTELIRQRGNPNDPAVLAAEANLRAAQDAYNENVSALRSEIDNYASAVQSAASTLKGPIDNLASSGLISDADLNTAKSTVNDIITSDAAALSAANAAFDSSEVLQQQQNYIDAMIDSGARSGRRRVRNAIAAYNTARAAQIAEQAEFRDSFQESLYPATDTFFAAHYEVYNAYEVHLQGPASTLSDAELAAAPYLEQEQLANDAYQAAANDLQAAEDEVAGAPEQLRMAEENYDLAVASYEAALDAYNQAGATGADQSGAILSYLDVDTTEIANNTIRFIRGEEGIPGFRSRTIDYDGDNAAEVWRLGDIVHSSPALVGAPSSGYDAQYRDRTYAAFREQYKNRRQVLYVGANDGMLHAFNAGFWNLADKKFELDGSFAGLGGKTAHPLGAELWSYIPRAALPHLQWLTDPNYAHSYYVDATPVSFDANIFTPDATHPHGWGTVLMVGMRFGGSPTQVDTDSNGSDDTTLRSSYSLFDITDPEKPPVLIAEISHPDLGYTTSTPTVVKKRVKGTSFDNTVQNDWYVAFGSGPTDLDKGSSAQTAGLFLYDLKTRSFVSGYAPLQLAGNSFVGDITSVDNGDDFVDDTLYFGVASGSQSGGYGGGVYRTRLDQPSTNSTQYFIKTNQPALAAPSVSTDRFGRRWVNFGTGRLLSSLDNLTSDQQNFYGVMEPVDSDGEFTWATVSVRDLIDSTNVEVKDTGEISQFGAAVQIPAGSDIDNFEQMVTAVRENAAGWTIQLQQSGSNPAARNLSKAAQSGNVLFFTAYLPSSLSCSPEGTSRLYGIDQRTGTAIPFEVFAPDDDPTTREGNMVDAYISLGQGMASAPIVLNSSDSKTVFTSMSTTEQVNTRVRTGIYKTGRQSWRQLILD